ncbi:hypothetical protein [Mycoplasma struthionis]|uniref:Uncharacterized protein n=1 Tax=Mycoplasma struthionis TaxID=538220 RepID=A0A502M2U2_9MOLU|nr:hypothetical protein [Mycoplasma struthionis]TPI02433.1 hypothetical protein FJM01_00720 [Mycoplasma struthionis]
MSKFFILIYVLFKTDILFYVFLTFAGLFGVSILTMLLFALLKKRKSINWISNFLYGNYIASGLFFIVGISALAANGINHDLNEKNLKNVFENQLNELKVLELN